jgi:hypothetical protein
MAPDLAGLAVEGHVDGGAHDDHRRTGFVGGLAVNIRWLSAMRLSLMSSVEAVTFPQVAPSCSGLGPVGLAAYCEPKSVYHPLRTAHRGHGWAKMSWRRAGEHERHNALR